MQLALRKTLESRKKNELNDEMRTNEILLVECVFIEIFVGYLWIRTMDKDRRRNHYEHIRFK